MSEDPVITSFEFDYNRKSPSQLINNPQTRVDLFNISRSKTNYTIRCDQKWIEYCKRYPLTAQVLDRLPEGPKPGDSGQRIIHNEGRNTLQMVLHVTAGISSWEKPHSHPILPLSKQPIADPESDNSSTLLKIFASKVKRKNMPSSIRQTTHPMKSSSLFSLPVSLADFLPLCAPFVPDLIRNLVNTIEGYCHKIGSWHEIYEPLVGERSSAREWVLSLLQLGNDDRELRRVLQTLPGSVVICMLRIFLGEFATKPLHFSTVLTRELVQRPLFDHFLRPNPNLRSLVQRAVLPVSRTELDTIAFLMIHILHALEYNPDPMDGKLRLCNVYGPLLISFAERPCLYRSTQTSIKSEEAALLDVILEVCDLNFWNHMSMLKICSAFEFQTQSEKNHSTRPNLQSRAKCPLDKVLTVADVQQATIAPRTVHHETKKENISGIMRSQQQNVSPCEALPKMSRVVKTGHTKQNWNLHLYKTCNYEPQKMFNSVGKLTTSPLGMNPDIRKNTTNKRNRLKNGKFVSIFKSSSVGTSPQVKHAYTPYSTHELIEEIKLYRLGRLAIPR